MADTDIAFRKMDGAYDFYPIDHIPIKDEIDQKYPLHDERIKIINFERSEEIEQILLERLGIPNSELEEESNYVDVRVAYSYPPEVFRAIAKIAFNYLAHSNESSVMLQRCFDPVRDFIRYGRGEWKNFVTIDSRPIVPDEPNGEAASVHLITISAVDSAIVASVALFNIIHYKVCLTVNYNGDPIKTGYGQAFDPHGKTSSKLGLNPIVAVKTLPLVEPVRFLPLIQCSLWLPV